MENDTLRRAGIAGALGFLVLGLASGALAGSPPALDATAATVRSYVNDHHGALTVAGVLYVVAPLLLVPFFVALGQRVRKGWQGALVGFGVTTIALAIAGGVLQAALFQAGTLGNDDHTLLLLHRLAEMTFDIGPAVPSIGFLVVAAIALPTDRARWLSPAAAIVAVLTLVSVVLGASTSSGGPGPLGFACFLLTVLWMAAASLSVLGDPAGAERAVSFAEA